jgi:hypothetical protein
VAAEELFLSMITLGEIRKGIEQKRCTDPGCARRLDNTMATICSGYHQRIIPVNEDVADEWGRMCVVYPNHMMDNLLSATAKVHGMTLVTRNLQDVQMHHILSLNPFT